MYCLFANSGNIAMREIIVDSLWNRNIFVDDNTLSVNITRIREKLAAIQAFHVSLDIVKVS